MKLENQVCTLEQAKKLKTILGELYGLFVYMENKALPSDSKIMLATQTESFKQMGKIEGSAWIKYYPAFTVSELSIMLPSETYMKRTGSEDSEYANWEWIDDGNEAGWGNYNTQVEAAADMLIIYLEKNKLSVEACNERLLA